MASPTPTPTRSYDLTVGVIVNMDEAIYMTSPEDSPLLTGLGADGLSVIAAAPLDEVVFSWMHDSILTPRSTCAVVVTADTVLTLATGERTRFSTGDVIVIGKQGDTNAEVIRVTGYGSTADTLTISRAWSGAATTYASDSIVIGVGTALPEGDDPEAPRVVDRTEVSNVTQIFGPTSQRLSATEQVVRKYGVSNELAHQTMKTTIANVIQREQAYLYGRKVNSTSAKIRTTGGMFSFVTTNVDNTSTQLTVAKIVANDQLAYNRGGVPERVMANPVALADLNDPGNTAIVRTTVEDPKRGRVRVETVETEMGTKTVVRNRWVHQSTAISFKRENIRRRILRPLSLERLAKTGDSDQVMIVCEEGLQVKGEMHMWKQTNLAYTGAN